MPKRKNTTATRALKKTSGLAGLAARRLSGRRAQIEAALDRAANRPVKKKSKR